MSNLRTVLTPNEVVRRAAIDRVPGEVLDRIDKSIINQFDLKTQEVVVPLGAIDITEDQLKIIQLLYASAGWLCRVRHHAADGSIALWFGLSTVYKIDQ